jgi:hypothetical protein
MFRIRTNKHTHTAVDYPRWYLLPWITRRGEDMALQDMEENVSSVRPEIWSSG